MFSIQSRPRLCVIDAVNYILTQNEIIVVSYGRKKNERKQVTSHRSTNKVADIRQ